MKLKLELFSSGVSVTHLVMHLSYVCGDISKTGLISCYFSYKSTAFSNCSLADHLVIHSSNVVEINSNLAMISYGKFFHHLQDFLRHSKAALGLPMPKCVSPRPCLGHHQVELISCLTLSAMPQRPT